MKISKLFHWLYASLCFLPLLVAPIFALAVRSDNNFEPISIEVQEEVLVDFNQLANVDYNVSTITEPSNVRRFSTNQLITNHKYYLSFDLYNFNSNQIYFAGLTQSYGFTPLKYELPVAPYVAQKINFIYLSVEDTNFRNLMIVNGSSNNFSSDNYIFVDLTQMFGLGNEPTLDYVNSLLIETNYAPIDSQQMLVNQPTLTTYNDTDVGSQYLYTLYNVTDKYMDFGNVFNLYRVNEWINANVFNGSVPLVWTIIWHYLDYWLLLSIFWLCFDVLIYVPLLAHRWLDKAAIA